jgi:hypothetical protein
LFQVQTAGFDGTRHMPEQESLIKRNAELPVFQDRRP